MIHNMPETVKKAGLRREYLDEKLEAIKREVDKGFSLGYMSPDYIFEKLEDIRRYIKAIENSSYALEMK